MSARAKALLSVKCPTDMGGVSADVEVAMTVEDASSLLAQIGRQMLHAFESGDEAIVLKLRGALQIEASDPQIKRATEVSFSKEGK